MILRNDLKDSDIPHRTTIRNNIQAIWEEYLTMLEDELKVKFPIIIVIAMICLLAYISTDRARWGKFH